MCTNCGLKCCRYGYVMMCWIKLGSNRRRHLELELRVHGSVKRLELWARIWALILVLAHCWVTLIYLALLKWIIKNHKALNSNICVNTASCISVKKIPTHWFFTRALFKSKLNVSPQPCQSPLHVHYSHSLVKKQATQWPAVCLNRSPGFCIVSEGNIRRAC